MWLEEIRDPKWHGTPAERAAEAYRELNSRAPAERWRGLTGGEDIREFVDRIRLGAEKFLQERGVHRMEGELPVWHIAEPGRRIALIAHAGTNTIVICHLLGLPPTPWEWERMVLRHALDQPARGDPRRRRLHLQPHRAVRRRAPPGGRPHALGRASGPAATRARRPTAPRTQR